MRNEVANFLSISALAVSLATESLTAANGPSTAATNAPLLSAKLAPEFNASMLRPTISAEEDRQFVTSLQDVYPSLQAAVFYTAATRLALLSTNFETIRTNIGTFAADFRQMGLRMQEERAPLASDKIEALTPVFTNLLQQVGGPRGEKKLMGFVHPSDTNWSVVNMIARCKTTLETPPRLRPLLAQETLRSAEYTGFGLKLVEAAEALTALTLPNAVGDPNRGSLQQQLARLAGNCQLPLEGARAHFMLKSAQRPRVVESVDASR